MKLLRRKDGGWKSGGGVERAPTGFAALRQDLRESSGGVFGPVRAVFADRSQTRSNKMFALADAAVDATATPVGRLITAVIALTLVYWLI